FLALCTAAPALAQTSVPLPRPAPPAKVQAPPPFQASFMTAPEPTYDEGTARRIAAAMLSYSAIEVRGGWPTLPASAARLGPGAFGPDVALLRQRLMITDDLDPQHAEGETYDATLAQAVRRF